MRRSWLPIAMLLAGFVGIALAWWLFGVVASGG